MKKFVSIMMAMVILLAALPCALGETFTLGSTVQVNLPEEWSGYMDNEGVVYFTEPDSGKFGTMMWVDTYSMLGNAFDAESIVYALRNSFLKSNEISDVTDINETNGFYWFKCNVSGFMAIAVDTSGQNLLYLYDIDDDVIRKVLNTISVTGEREKTAVENAETLSDISYETCAGFYDAYIIGQTNTNANLILTPDGYGRIINDSNSESLTFEYTISGGQATADSGGGGATFVWKDADTATICVDGMELDFLRRAPVSDTYDFTGTWKLSSLISNGITYSAGTLALLGVSGEMHAWADGSLTWHAVTDSDSTVAMGWGVDAQGVYMKNGNGTIRITISGATATLEMNGNTIQYERAD